MPSWEYDWDTFPVAWFGAKRSAYLDEKGLADLANFPLVLFGWQDLQLETNYTNLLAAQEEQARQVKVLYPDKPVFVYIGFNGAQPYYAAEKRYFDDDDRYHDFFFRNATGGHWGPSSGYKCNAEGDKEKLPACRNYAWNFFNASARAAFLAVAEDLVASDTSSNGAHKFDGVFFDGACQFFSSKHWQGASNLPADTSDEAIRVIWIGLVSKLCAICAAHNKYPMFNLHLDALNFNLTGPTTGNEATLMGSLNGQGLFRYNEGSPPLATVKYLDNRIKELPFSLPWLAHVQEHGNATVAAFLIGRGPYSYISDGSYTGTNFWHTSPGKYAYGAPVDTGPTRAVGADGSIVYRRKYQRANITLTCPAPKSASEVSSSKSKCEGLIEEQH